MQKVSVMGMVSCRTVTVYCTESRHCPPAKVATSSMVWVPSGRLISRLVAVLVVPSGRRQR